MEFMYLHRTLRRKEQRAIYSGPRDFVSLTRVISAAVVLIFWTASAIAEERVIGLLSLPEVLGERACDKFIPQMIPLYSAMDAGQAFAEIRVDKYWTFPEAGGCAGLSVNIHQNEGQGTSPLITEEFAYESPAAIVLEKQNGWYKIRTSTGSAWVKATHKDKYHTLENLLQNNICYVASNSKIDIYSHPGGDEIIGRASSGDSVHVLKAHHVQDQLWLFIQVLTTSICESSEQQRVLIQGWTPAHTPSGKLAIWFYSRGC